MFIEGTNSKKYFIEGTNSNKERSPKNSDSLKGEGSHMFTLL